MILQKNNKDQQCFMGFTTQKMGSKTPDLLFVFVTILDYYEVTENSTNSITC